MIGRFRSRNLELFARPAKRMRQPKKDTLRAQLVLAAREIEFWKTEYRLLFDQIYPPPWWRRVFARPANFKPRTRK